MTPLEQQQAAEKGMIDALASGNREKFEEFKNQFQQAQRLRYADLFGYDPGSSSGGGGGSSKTVQQMRAELKVAGYPNWENAGDAEIETVYKRTAKPEDQPGSGAPGGGMGSGPNAGLGAQIKSIYKTVAAKKGVASLPPTDPDLIQAIVAATGLQAPRVQAALQQGRTYYEKMGEVIPDNVLGQSFNTELPFGQNPSTEARKFGEDQRRFDQTFAEGKRQFDTQQMGGMARALLDADSSRTGPRDYRVMQRMRAGGKDILDQLYGDTPQQGFGLAGTPERATSDDLLESLGLQRRPRVAA